jgi:hypothetical protein
MRAKRQATEAERAIRALEKEVHREKETPPRARRSAPACAIIQIAVVCGDYVDEMIFVAVKRRGNSDSERSRGCRWHRNRC